MWLRWSQTLVAFEAFPLLLAIGAEENEIFILSLPKKKKIKTAKQKGKKNVLNQ